MQFYNKKTVLHSRKSIPYCTGWYGWNLSYRYLCRYRNKVVSFRKIYQLYCRFGCTSDLYRISAGKFIPDRKKKSISFSFSPSTSDDLYILDLKSGPWTDFGCCYFISLSLGFSNVSNDI